MHDREWLERVSWAYKIYSQTQGASEDVQDFITWLYAQYGIVEPKREEK